MSCNCQHANGNVALQTVLSPIIPTSTPFAVVPTPTPFVIQATLASDGQNHTTHPVTNQPKIGRLHHW